MKWLGARNRSREPQAEEAGCTATESKYKRLQGVLWPAEMRATRWKRKGVGKTASRERVRSDRDGAGSGKGG